MPDTGKYYCGCPVGDLHVCRDSGVEPVDGSGKGPQLFGRFAAGTGGPGGDLSGQGTFQLGVSADCCRDCSAGLQPAMQYQSLPAGFDPGHPAGIRGIYCRGYTAGEHGSPGSGADILLPILLFPVVIPVLVAAVKASSGFLEGLGWVDVSTWVNLVIVYDVIFTAVSFMVFDFVVEE